jgi:hypothetical protein
VRALQVPVLAMLPLPVDPARTRRRAMKVRWSIAAVLALMALALLSFHFFYMPLDVAWYGLLRRVYN